MGRWPVGVKPVGDGDRDGSFLTPEDEFSRWAKNGKGPSGKRLAVSVTAVLLALTCLPVWARTTWTQRARLPLSEIAQETQAQTEPLAFPPPKMRILAFANGAGAGAGRDAETIWSELKGLHSSRDTVITLAVVTGSGECVTRGRGEGKGGTSPVLTRMGNQTRHHGKTQTGMPRRSHKKTQTLVACVVSARAFASSGRCPIPGWMLGLRRKKEKVKRTARAAQSRTATFFCCSRRMGKMCRW